MSGVSGIYWTMGIVGIVVAAILWAVSSAYFKNRKQ